MSTTAASPDEPENDKTGGSSGNPSNLYMFIPGLGAFGAAGIGPGIGGLIPQPQRNWYFDQFMRQIEEAKRQKAAEERRTADLEAHKREFEQYLRNMEPKMRRAKVLDKDDEPWIDPPKGSRKKLLKGSKNRPYSAEGYAPSKPEPEVITEVRWKTKDEWRFHWTKASYGSKVRVRLGVEHIYVEEKMLDTGRNAVFYALIFAALVMACGIYQAATDGWSPLPPSEALWAHSVIGMITALGGVLWAASFRWRLRRARRKMVMSYLKSRFRNQLTGYGDTENIHW